MADHALTTRRNLRAPRLRPDVNVIQARVDRTMGRSLSGVPDSAVCGRVNLFGSRGRSGGRHSAGLRQQPSASTRLRHLNRRPSTPRRDPSRDNPSPPASSRRGAQRSSWHVKVVTPTDAGWGRAVGPSGCGRPRRRVTKRRLGPTCGGVRRGGPRYAGGGPPWALKGRGSALRGGDTTAGAPWRSGMSTDWLPAVARPSRWRKIDPWLRFKASADWPSCWRKVLLTLPLAFLPIGPCGLPRLATPAASLPGCSVARPSTAQAPSS